MRENELHIPDSTQSCSPMLTGTYSSDSPLHYQTVPVLVNKMDKGLFSGPKSDWHSTAHVHMAKPPLCKQVGFIHAVYLEQPWLELSPEPQIGHCLGEVLVGRGSKLCWRLCLLNAVDDYGQ